MSNKARKGMIRECEVAGVLLKLRTVLTCEIANYANSVFMKEIRTAIRDCQPFYGLFLFFYLTSFINFCTHVGSGTVKIKSTPFPGRRS